MCASRVIPANEYRRVRWRNGLGWTREIAAAAPDAATAVHSAGASDAGLAAEADESGVASGPASGPAIGDWRISIAELDVAAPFSRFPGLQREIVLLAGAGLRLADAAGDTLGELQPPHGRHCFDGAQAVVGEPVDGPVQVFNLMWRPAAVRARLWHRPLVGPMVLFAEPASTWIVHLFAGQARFADGSGLPPLAMGDTAVLEATDARLRQVLDGGGEALLIELRPVAA